MKGNSQIDILNMVEEFKNGDILSLEISDSAMEVYSKLKNVNYKDLTQSQEKVYFKNMNILARNLYLKEMENWNKKGIDLGLSRMKELLGHLDNPQDELKVIHVAGTNGKGSTCNYLKYVLEEAGYKIGVYSSPNIVDYNDSVKINDDYIPFTDLYELLVEVKNTWENNHKGNDYISFFEASTAVALLYFYNQKIDYGIIEVGLGGRNDATNVFSKKILSIITSISMDHIGILGDTLEKIAFQKAGIIQKNDNVIIYPSDKNAVEVIKKECMEKFAKYEVLGKNDIFIKKQNQNESIFTYKNFENIKIQMSGQHQIYNASLSLLALNNLKSRGVIKISDTNIKNGIKKARLQGRLEEVSENPKIILDGAHNDSAMEYLVDYIDKLECDNLRIVMGVLKDKFHKNIFEKLSHLKAEFYLTEVPFEGRKMDIKDMKEELFEFTNDIVEFKEPKVAIETAIKDSSKNDIILVTGSLYLISEIRGYLVEKYKK